MSADLNAVIAATARWLLRAYPPARDVFDATLAEVQVRQAVTVSAWLRYPTALDASLMALVGPGGSARLDWLSGADATGPTGEGDDTAWRTWVDEVVASWAACLLADSELAAAAARAVIDSEHVADLPYDFRRLTEPDHRDRQAAVLLRHPDLLAPVAALHRTPLAERLDTGSADAA